jgi:thymidylate synthase ThyX
MTDVLTATDTATLEYGGTSAKVLVDTIGPRGHRLTTMEVTFPRFILPEFNTHRMLSRNSSSSRAIPLAKVLERVRARPFVPDRWWANQPGMSSRTEIVGADAEKARQAWLAARDAAVSGAEALGRVGATGVHKQQASRLLEPFAWHTVLVSSTCWRNFFALRTHPAAQPEFRELARLMLDAYTSSTPAPLPAGHWHLPLVRPGEEGEFTPDDLRRVSVGRCARVSYLTHDGLRDPAKDVALHDRLLASGHMSPFEHVARVMTSEELGTSPWSGNFHGFVQYRKLLPNESDYSAALSQAPAPDDALLEAILAAE